MRILKFEWNNMIIPSYSHSNLLHWNENPNNHSQFQVGAAILIPILPLIYASKHIIYSHFLIHILIVDKYTHHKYIIKCYFNCIDSIKIKIVLT